MKGQRVRLPLGRPVGGGRKLRRPSASALLGAKAQPGDPADVGEPGDSAQEPVGISAAPIRDLVEPEGDHERDQHELGEGRRENVDPLPALVPARAAQPADRLAPTAEQCDEPEPASTAKPIRPSIGSPPIQKATRTHVPRNRANAGIHHLLRHQGLALDVICMKHLLDLPVEVPCEGDRERE